MKRFFIIVFSLIIAAGVAVAAYPFVSPYHERLRTEISDPKKREAAIRDAVAFEKTHYRAVLGDKVAQYAFGIELTSGNLGFKNTTQAVTWFEKSAKQGYPLAEFAMAHHYFTGDGVRKDEADGATWTQKALETSLVPQARELMGLLLVGGIGEKQDMDQGLGYLKTGQTSESLQIASDMDTKFKAIYALPKEQRDAALAEMAAAVKTDVTAKFPGIEKKLAEATLVPPPVSAPK
jgi:TPR repeat protein